MKKTDMFWGGMWILLNIVLIPAIIVYMFAISEWLFGLLMIVTISLLWINRIELYRNYRRLEKTNMKYDKILKILKKLPKK